MFEEKPFNALSGPQPATVAPDDATMQATEALESRTQRIAAPRRTDVGQLGADTEADGAGSPGRRQTSPGVVPADVGSLRRVGRYLLRERLGSGGMGTVFKAHDPSIGRDVAIKFLHATLCEHAEARSRFLREARAAGRLSHPSIVVVHDVGEIEGRPYMAMELVDGKPLAAELVNRPLPLVRDAVVIGVQLARALDYAHARGIVHRDIKPGNVMRVAGTPAIKVTDFGIAHMEAAGSEHSTRAGAILGTPQYMSPEQAQGQKLDGRSDLFSVGVVLYEMLAGQRPFQGEGAVAVAMNIVGEEPVPIARLRPELPGSLRRVVERCLKKAPSERFQTGRELADALDRVLAEIDDIDRERTLSPRVPPAVKSAAAMALVVVVVMSITAAFITQRQYAAMTNQMIDSGATVLRFIAAQNAVAALSEDWDAVDVSVHRAVKIRNLQSIAVTDRAGIVRAAGDPALVGRPYNPLPGRPLKMTEDGVAVSRHDAEGTTVLDFRLPMTFQGKKVGTVALALAEEPIARVGRLSIALMSLLVVVTVLAVAVAAYFLATWFGRPIKAIASAMDEIERGHFDHRIGRHRDDGFGLLYAAYDRMAQSLQEREARLHVSRRPVRTRHPSSEAATAVSTSVSPPPSAGEETAVRRPSWNGAEPGRPAALAKDDGAPTGPAVADRPDVTSAP